MQPIEIDWQLLSHAAWGVRERALVHGKTKVGAAVLTMQGNIHAGCNVEHRFRSHDVHAEVNALSTMASAGEGPAVAVMVVSPRERFTPCGACLDWIFELGGPDCAVSFQGEPGGAFVTLRADELMPHYPY
ncbi:hypothetical protein BTO20_06820 [Mycobacterium dioxanotrophicus]|jgi:cytidine deaminase|uniref:CMP/dCMP-type deaminase domain-containing protein n=2 Tax=Mycobacterium dioxanotrophicus TaxID=482462 RepID=A0A1Y0BZL0_9MYCO|nr:hypothetical protein BTO20_06820 [Mycobacterium dioxanotrophicus]